ncbi:MAG: phosphomannose isomerase type II C-terminal cupin domain [Candidatus Paceibacterota bacterium]
MINKSNIFQVERPWGNFRQFTKSEISTVKIITVMPNEMLSLQSHKKRAEFWHVIAGSGVVQIEEIKTETKVGDEHVIAVGEKHRLSAGSNGIAVLEIATGDFDEEDVMHFEDKYGRV